jgi:hypothetical protein
VLGCGGEALECVAKDCQLKSVYCSLLASGYLLCCCLLCADGVYGVLPGAPVVNCGHMRVYRGVTKHCKLQTKNKGVPIPEPASMTTQLSQHHTSHASRQYTHSSLKHDTHSCNKRCHLTNTEGQYGSAAAAVLHLVKPGHSQSQHGHTCTTHHPCSCNRGCPAHKLQAYTGTEHVGSKHCGERGVRVWG